MKLSSKFLWEGKQREKGSVGCREKGGGGQELMCHHLAPPPRPET